MNHEKQQINSTFSSPSSQSWTILLSYNSSPTRYFPWNVFGKLEKGKPHQLRNRKELGRYSLTLSNSTISLSSSSSMRFMWINLRSFIFARPCTANLAMKPPGDSKYRHLVAWVPWNRKNKNPLIFVGTLNFKTPKISNWVTIEPKMKYSVN